MVKGHIVNQVLQDGIERNLESEGLRRERDEGLRKRGVELQALMGDEERKNRLKEFRVSRSLGLEGRRRERAGGWGVGAGGLSVSKDHKDKIKSDAQEYKANKD